MKKNSFKVKISWIFFFLQLVFLGFVKAQNSIDQVQNLEKVFLHLDKDYYLSGTAIRYSAYVVDAQTHRPSKLSSILDVKLINQKSDEIVAQKVVLKNGRAEGKLELSKSLASGTYLLIAYTSRSVHSNHKLSFKQKLTIINPDEELPIPNQKDDEIVFYPEGGHLIGGHLNSVAFKASLREKDWNGVIVSNKGDTVAMFNPAKLNYGQFSFFVQDDLSYTAKINGKETQSDFPLPVVQNDKISGRIVNTESDTLALVVNIGHDFSGMQIGMLVYNNGEIILGARQMRKGRRMIFKLPKTLLGRGLNSIFLYDEHQEILSERNFYKSDDVDNVINLKIPDDELKKKDEISLPVKVEKSFPRPLELSASLSIKNLNYFDAGAENGMKMYFEIFSVLNILDPAKVLSALTTDAVFTDLFLQTRTTGINNVSELNSVNQGARLNNQDNKDYFTIRGSVVDGPTNTPIQDSVIYCSVIGQIPQFYAGKTDENGRFNFQIRSFFGESDIILKVANTDENKSNLKYKITSNSINVKDFGLDREMSFNRAKVQDYINFHKQSNLITRVYNPENMQETEVKKPKSTTGFFPSYSDSKDLTEYEYIKDFKQLSRELLPGLTLKGKQNSVKIYLREIDDSGRNSFIGRFEKEPLILIDGLPIFDHSRILNYNTAKIKFLSLINKKYFINGVFHDGIVEIGTRDSDYYKQHSTNHYWFKMQGFYQGSGRSGLRMNFTEAHEKDQLPDFRDILYWNGSFSMESQTENRLEFLSSDDTGDFLLVIHGIGQYGNIIQHTSILDIKDQ